MLRAQLEIQRLLFEIPKGHVRRHVTQALEHCGKALALLAKEKYPDQDTSE